MCVAEACDAVAVAELIAHHAALIGKDVVVGGGGELVSWDFDEPVAASVVVHLNGVARQHIADFGLAAGGHIELCAPLCLVFDV